jgi:hypothetical protein
MSGVMVGWLANYTNKSYFIFTPDGILEGSTFLHFFDSLIIRILSSFLDPVALFNLLILINIFLFIFFCLILFKAISGRRNLVIYLLFSLTMVVQPYFVYRVISGTSSLYYIFLFPLIFYLLYKRSNTFFVALITLLAFGFSSYYGYFLAAIVCFWYLASLITKDLSVRQFFTKVFQYLALLVIGLLIFFGALIMKNSALTSDYSFGSGDATRVYRAIEDFYSFSLRPWYFFIPPERSVYFGEFSDGALKLVENTGYYLADDYAAEEMAGSYMGWPYLLGLFTVCAVLLVGKLFKKKFDVFSEIYVHKALINKLLLVLLFIFLVSLPPSFTINGLKIYTPSYILYYLVPMFRVLARWAVAIFFILLLINLILFSSVMSHIKSMFGKVFLIVIFIVINYFTFALRLPIINVSKPPEEIGFIKALPVDSKIAIYPSGDFYSIFWVLKHEKVLMNPRDVFSGEGIFDADSFSEMLITPEGAVSFDEHGGNYLVLYLDRISDQSLQKIMELNSSIESRSDLVSFFELHVGEAIFNKQNVLIFENN